MSLHPSIREKILAQLKTNLDTINTQETPVGIYRNRVEPLARNEVPAIIVEPVNDQPDTTKFFDTLENTMRVRVTTLVRADTPGVASDTFTRQVHSTLMADPTVSSNALDLIPDRTEFSFYEADVALGIISQDFLIRYRTSRTDLTE